ncbi:hypothetical protein GCM10007916_19140 [Psychromonas marina]|uniref:DUF3124 domain-containing protein n=1 Tax=Psychromonas marina TaxID=88364 RepID=A0ABQ6E088_9GAMM|nr:DUF3124 domain-containing protein [Psychromonas marina]GLS90847.1 hypothetical protein GCM10007916_19140 [Psychromonas marina]
MSSKNKLSVFLSIFSLLTVTVLAVYLGNLLHSIETIEEQLNHQAQQFDYKPVNIVSNDLNSAYVPAYSHIYGDGGKAILLETTLSIRNTDPTKAIQIHSIDYYDTAGNKVKNYLSEAIQLDPLSTVDFLAEKNNTSGGAGANFLIYWSNPNDAITPIFEAVMVGSGHGKNVSFVSRAPI